MTQTLNRAGRPLFFPPSLAKNAAGVIVPTPMDELLPFAAQVAPEQLFPFVRRLINGTSRRRRQPKWAAVNRMRLELAKLIIDRALAEQVVTV